MNRRESIRALSAGIAAVLCANGNALASLAPPKRMVVYKSPTCGCCGAWVEHVRAAGYTVQEVNVDDVTPYKQKHGVPLDLASCHTGVIGGYAVEGHVPADVIDRLLKERPKHARAIAVPGMPLGSPGMEAGNQKQPYNVMLIDRKGKRSVYAKR